MSMNAVHTLALEPVDFRMKSRHLVALHLYDVIVLSHKQGGFTVHNVLHKLGELLRLFGVCQRLAYGEIVGQMLNVRADNVEILACHMKQIHIQTDILYIINLFYAPVNLEVERVHGSMRDKRARAAAYPMQTAVHWLY